MRMDLYVREYTEALEGIIENGLGVVNGGQNWQKSWKVEEELARWRTNLPHFTLTIPWLSWLPWLTGFHFHSPCLLVYKVQVRGVRNEGSVPIHHTHKLYRNTRSIHGTVQPLLSRSIYSYNTNIWGRYLTYLHGRLSQIEMIFFFYPSGILLST